MPIAQIFRNLGPQAPDRPQLRGRKRELHGRPPRGRGNGAKRVQKLRFPGDAFVETAISGAGCRDMKTGATSSSAPPLPPDVAGAPASRAYPSKLFVEVTTRCNLGCVMCVKQAADAPIREGDLPAATFEALEPAFPRLEALVLNGIGEPLLHPRLEEFVERARGLLPRSGWIGFQSNGLLLTRARATALARAGLDRLCLSLDAASPETFRKVREGGELEGVARAFAAIGSAKEECGRPDLEVGVEFVAMRSNIGELPAALRWAASRGARFAIVTHMLAYESRHAAEAAFDANTDAAIAIFQEWSERAAREGLDIRRYPEILWRYAKTADDRRLVILVETMKDHALHRGVFLDLRKLFGRDRARLERVAAVFEEARQVAREEGLDLKLPGVSLAEKRSCGFVEEGGAFVSWEGAVSPCYFLWHRSTCFAHGWKQTVQPKVFGRLPGTGILEIWNDPEFRAFREDVIRYDYPSCVSCGFAPCDYVQAEEFEQDCHIRNVRCGSCLWCMGAFQCLR